MKRLSLLFALLAVTLMVSAIPAKQGIWKSVKLSDGSEVRVELVGDEFGHYWRDANGTCYNQSVEGDYYEVVDVEALKERAEARRVKARSSVPGIKKTVLGGDHDPYEGTKKGLIILVDFPDMQFQEGHDQALYHRIANEENFTHEEGFRGSVKDYFKDQSDGKFELDFDVVGPYTMPNSYVYYGRNNYWGDDSNPDAMIVSACNAADESVNFADYDWDGDGEVDQVFVLYAGRGEATEGGENTIWPHESNLNSYGRSLTLDGVKINTYACSNEMRTETQIDGIGTICHEFSHCLGLPDMYDTNYQNFGMGPWDVMALGSHNNDGFLPPFYTSYERMYCGWKQPIEINSETSITDMKAISDGGDSYIIYNGGNSNEYYLLENRQLIGWDAGQYASGLLVIHVDFNRTAWSNNWVNRTTNHQRCTIVPADNSANAYGDTSYSGDTWPHGSNNSITPYTTPNNSVFNANLDGTNFLGLSILRIKNNSDGTVSFDVVSNNNLNENKPEGAVFYESFDLCDGEGGNDGIWGGSGIGNASLVTDNSGWVSIGGRGADQCAKFGTNTQNGRATTPAFSIEGETVVSFKAAPWTGESSVLTLSVGSGNATLSETTFTMEAGKWKNFSTILNGDGEVKLVFRGDNHRFFLDEVAAVPAIYSSITEITPSDDARNGSMDIYTLDGRYVGKELDRLMKGIYIIGGKKVVK